MWKRGCLASQLCTVGALWCVVVADQVDVEVVGDLGVDGGEELAELDGAVAPVQGGDDGAGADVEGGEQAGGARAHVVVGAFLGHAGSLGTPAGCVPAPVSGTSRPRTAPPRPRAGRGRARRCHRPSPRTADHWTA